MTARFPLSAALLLVAACATTGGASTVERPGGAAPDAERLRDLDDLAAEQARRIGELEARVALLEEEARRSRSVVSKPTEPVRIGRAARESERDVGDHGATVTEDARASDGEAERVPVLRLDEGTASNLDGWVPPAVPPGVPERLAVVPLPAAPPDPAAARPAPGEVPPAAPPAGSAVGAESGSREQYRAALKLVRERAYAKALAALAAFLAAHPGDPFTDDAMYWRAEVHYAERRYAEALEGFTALLARFPDGSRVPDALLKIGMCHRRLGDADNARAYFRRVRQQYPDTEAARLVPAEGST